MTGPRRNPFPAAAVARLSVDPGDLHATIPTPAVRRALDYTDAYLAGPGKTGNVIAVVGEYGTGKTHLALSLRARLTRAGNGHSTRTLYLDAPADTFVALYRQRFVVELRKSDVRERVSDYYADIVADSLADSELTAEAAERLRTRDVDPHSAVRAFGLMESALLQELQRRLGVVTENAAFGTALGLFLRPEFEDAVWEWLRGHAPDPALAERGITEAIDTDTTALEAIGVFALLHGRQGHRFALVIDELEKILSPPHVPGAGSVLAFKKLLEVFSGAGAFLVLSGLPDFLEALPEDARQRIGCIVKPSALSVADTLTYVRDANAREGRGQALDPFNEEVVEYLVDLAGGNARKIIKLLFHGFQSAVAAGTDVTTAMVREVARDQFELTTGDDVRAETARVLDLAGFAFETGHRFPDGGRADFWIPVGESGGCAILISDSVLQPGDVRALREAAVDLRAGRQDTAVLLVVNGYLAEGLSASLAAAFDREPLTHSLRHFAKDFDAAVKGAVQRLEDATREDNLSLLRDQVDRLGRQQSRMLETLLKFQRDQEIRAEEVEDSLRSIRDRESSVINHVTNNHVNRFDGGPPPAPPLPGELDLIFTGTLEALDVAEILRREAAQSLGGDFPSGAFLESSTLEALGTALWVRTLVEEFRLSISDWFTTARSAGFFSKTDLNRRCEQFNLVLTATLNQRRVSLSLRILGDFEWGRAPQSDFVDLLFHLPIRVERSAQMEAARSGLPRRDDE
ncbi:hypothetical protein EDD29_6593 [Actinocorallia herbida]|uniref:AAA+ ATPase domain-containing protein n=1 Tax=Actinocorallia herbida TaxID=58109 RepID=A0A3N1D721_9ACTN|nr:hypothetical protein [Actinocorallia herbida]ROO88908.1 hypothetical protein EDD29_6593 [Actinocorallia herbida]